MSCLPLSYADYFFVQTGDIERSNNKLVRLLRAFRLLKLLRLVRIKRILDRWEEEMYGKRTLRVGKLIFAIIVASHWVRLLSSFTMQWLLFSMVVTMSFARPPLPSCAVAGFLPAMPKRGSPLMGSLGFKDGPMKCESPPPPLPPSISRLARATHGMRAGTEARLCSAGTHWRSERRSTSVQCTSKPTTGRPAQRS